NVLKLTGSGFVWDEASRTLTVTALPYCVGLGPTGLKLWTWAGGGKTFCHWHRLKNGKTRQPTLGKRPIMSVDDAADKYVKWSAAIQEGRDPYGEFLADVERQKQALTETCQAVFDLFVAKRCSNLKAKANVERLMRKHFISKFGSVPIREVTK